MDNSGLGIYHSCNFLAPAGVPVSTRSPGLRENLWDINERSCPTGKIISLRKWTLMICGNIGGMFWLTWCSHAGAFRHWLSTKSGVKTYMYVANIKQWYEAVKSSTLNSLIQIRPHLKVVWVLNRVTRSREEFAHLSNKSLYHCLVQLLKLFLFFFVGWILQYFSLVQCPQKIQMI